MKKQRNIFQRKAIKIYPASFPEGVHISEIVLRLFAKMDKKNEIDLSVYRRKKICIELKTTDRIITSAIDYAVKQNLMTRKGQGTYLVNPSKITHSYFSTDNYDFYLIEYEKVKTIYEREKLKNRAKHFPAKENAAVKKAKDILNNSKPFED